MADINLVEDSNSTFNFTILDQNGTAVNLLGATVLFIYKNSAGTFTKSCIIDDGVNGIAHVDIEPSDIDIGNELYEGEIKVTTADGNIYTVYSKITFYVRKKVE